MSYINVGVFINGMRPPSKKALREALRDAPETVIFDQTALIRNEFNGGPIPGGTYITPPLIPAGTNLTVVGPDPYRNRKWYASVIRDSDTGRILVR